MIENESNVVLFVNKMKVELYKSMDFYHFPYEKVILFNKVSAFFSPSRISSFQVHLSFCILSATR